jgi:hypothetical protein
MVSGDASERPKCDTLALSDQVRDGLRGLLDRVFGSTLCSPVKSQRSMSGRGR